MPVDPPRIFCPRCRANNFLGQTNCWQCGSSLPPPEASGYSPSSASPPANMARGAQLQPPQPYVPAPQWTSPQAFPQTSSTGSNRVIWFAVVPAVLVLVGVILFLVLRLNAKQALPKDDLQAQIERLKAQQGAMMGQKSSESLDTESDQTTQEAKREIQRLKDKAGLQTPQADINGDIRLQSGGKISTEEWNKARSSIRKSSTYNPP